jgi:peptide/nickel transport system permease protein
VLIFLLKRFFWALVLLWAITLITFVVFFMLPDSSRNAQRSEQGFSAGLQTQYNAHGSFPHQYVVFITHIARGDLGHSIRSSKTVVQTMQETLPITGSLVIGGMILCIMMAIPIGLISALYPRSLLDRGLMLWVLILVSCQPFWLGLMLSYFLGVRAHAFPVSGYCTFGHHAEYTTSYFCSGPKYWAYHLFLPWLTFAALFAAFYARMIRASLLEQLNEDYVRTARAKGASQRRVVRVHVLRNATLPVITMIGMDVGIAFAGALFIEAAFNLPGMGQLLVHSLANGDVPVILGIVLTVSLAVVIANLVVDILYSVLDPRVRLFGPSDSLQVSRAAVRQLRQPQQAPEPASPT